MTYCLAWKKDQNVYMIADTAVSETCDKIKTNINTFGEVQGLYGKYYVQEGQLKIFKISSNLAISYSGNVAQAMEIIEAVYNTFDKLNINELMRSIENSYCTYAVTMIFIFSKSQGNSHIYLFSNGRFSECDYAEIGSGQNISFFSDDIRSIINELYSNKIEKEYYLSIVISSIQCYILKNNSFSQGVGGVVTGIVLNNTLKWFRDTEYYLFDEDILESKTMSVIVRNNSIFSSSDIDGGVRGMINTITDNEIWNDLYKRKGIIKSLNTKNAFYYIFYSKKYNVAYFMNVNGYLHNIHFRRYIRRDEEKIDFVYTFRPDFKEYFVKLDSHNERLPSIVEMQVKSIGYVPHEEILKQCNENDIFKRCKYKEMDFDFSEMDYKDFNISLVAQIKKIVNNYHNLVLIDYHYLCSVIEEKINLYKPFCSFTIHDLTLRAVVNNFMKQMVPDEFEKYLFCAVKSNTHTKQILDLDIDNFLKKYDNFLEINTCDLKNDFCGVLFQLMKNYYINDAFFHLDKFIIIADDIDTMNLIDKIVPKFNFNCTNPDIILVRNLNGLTNMDGRLRYIVIDYLVAFILGISKEKFQELETLSHTNQSF